MLSRMQVSRCCCDDTGDPPEIHIDFVQAMSIESYDNNTGPLDPIQGRFFDPRTPQFQWGDSLFVDSTAKGMMFAVEPENGPFFFQPIPQRTYDRVYARFFGLSEENSTLIPLTDHFDQSYELYVWDQVDDWATASLLADGSGIPRSQLSGPVPWSNAGLNWVDPAGNGVLSETPNLAGLANPVIARLDWDQWSSALIIVVENKTKSGTAAPDGTTWHFPVNTAGIFFVG